MSVETITHADLRSDPRIASQAIVLTYKDASTQMEVRIAPRFGSNIYEYTYNQTPLFYCDYALLTDRDWTGCFVLWPFPNRVRDKKYTFEGETYSLEAIVRKKGNYPLIHGLVDDREWSVGTLSHTDMYARAETFIQITPESSLYTYFPFASRLTLTFTLDASGLEVGYGVVNHSDKNMPFGFALHPYFALLSTPDETFVTLPAQHVMEADNELLPTGTLIPLAQTNYNLNSPLAVSALSLDHVFTSLDRTRVPIIEHRAQKLKVLLESSADFTHMVLYTNESGFICFENQTGSTDMINLHARAVATADRELMDAAHLLILPPKQTHTGFIKYRISSG